jgi:hypothetical protein
MPWPTELVKEVIGPFPASFETAEQGTSKTPVNHDVNLTFVHAIVTKALAGTDAGTITVKDAGDNTLATLSFPASSAIGTEKSATIANKRIRKSSFFQVTSAKTTVGGKVLVTLHGNRVPTD